MDDAEIAVIAKALRLNVATFTKRYVVPDGARRSLIERKNGDCIFLERDADGRAGCAIHAARPTQCRTWPFWKSNLQSKRTWAAAAKGCPGMDAGEYHALPVIQAALASNGAMPL